MAEPAVEDRILHRFPLSNSVDAVRFLPAVSAFDRYVAAAIHDPSTSSSSLEIHALTSHPRDPNKPQLQLHSSCPLDSKVTSLKVPHSPAASLLPLAASTFAGSLHFLFVDPVEGTIESEASVTADAKGFHCGAISDVDLGSGRECVSVGVDGRVNLVTVGDGRVGCRRIGDSKGLVSYTAVKWGSPTEFATGGLGFGVQLWDQRKADGMVSQLKGDWAKGATSGIVHSIDIHPSRKHICVVGGSSGTIFAWDLRWQQQPILLSGVGLSPTVRPACESEVWEVRCDSLAQQGFSSASSTKILPVMMCSEDGILAVIGQDEEPIELLAENCAINTFDIDQQNPSDVVCSLEWESIALLMRPRNPLVTY